MKIAVAMSGGVDSSVTAALMKEEGHDVVGLFMKTGVSHQQEETTTKGCCSLGDQYDAQRVADRLDIPFYHLNYKHAFQRIIDHFVDEYSRARTPNPCVRCNQWLKFGALLEEARALGAEAVATGHYARTESDGERAALYRGRDRDKDQSYVLFVLPQKELRRARFPLGKYTKEEVRGLAGKFGLSVQNKRESQDICFVPKGGYAEILQKYAPGSVRAGEIVDTGGTVLGEHPGIQYYTVGQRKGLGIAAGKPHYVVELDAQTNRVVVGEAQELLKEECTADSLNWTSGIVPDEPVEVQAQIRYHHNPTPATVEPVGDGTVRVRFATPQKAVTPGQAVVFYQDDLVLGGGWIC